LRTLKARAARSREESALSHDLLAATDRPGRAAVTLDMIDAAPSYEARATLVRDFVRQDPARAATAVRQLMAERSDG
jgi:flagellar M-ring protein FliF